MKRINDFLIEANRQGYASGISGKKEKDKSTTIEYSKGDWKFHDNFFGGEPYGGREVIFIKDKPVWIMVYYGRVLSVSDPDEVYKILRKALSRPIKKMPIRGPKSLKSDRYSYRFSFQGSLEDFVANESIYLGDQEVYSATFLGGNVDQRRGD